MIGYSRAWLARPEVSVRIARSRWEALSEDLRYLLRANPIVPDDRLEPPNEADRTFAY